MVSTSRLCRADRLRRRDDLVVRPVPEIRMYMVYRPRPARLVTLNATSWLLLDHCDGSTVAEIEHACAALLAGRGRNVDAEGLRQGLEQLVDLALVEVVSLEAAAQPHKEARRHE